MKTFLFSIIVLLILVSLSFAQVNQGVRTRPLWEECTLDAGQADTSEIVLNLSGISEQGFSTLVMMTDTTDTFNVWFSSGSSVRYFGVKDTVWTTRVQCVWAEIITTMEAFGHINLPFLQSEILVDSSDARTGYMPAEYLRISVEPAGDSLETIFDHTFLVKVLFK